MAIVENRSSAFDLTPKRTNAPTNTTMSDFETSDAAKETNNDETNNNATSPFVDIKHKKPTKKERGLKSCTFDLHTDLHTAIKVGAARSGRSLGAYIEPTLIDLCVANGVLSLEEGNKFKESLN